MKTTFGMSFMLGMLLLIPCLYSFGQVSITPDSTPPHPSSMLEVKSTDKGMLIPRMTQAQRLAIDNPATGLLVCQFFPAEAQCTFYYYDGNAWTRVGDHTGLSIGKAHQGGIIFHLDETGRHGLIVSTLDLSTSQAWSNVTQTAIGDSARSVWNGLRNSQAIVEQVGHTSSAAQLCLNYVNPNTGTGTYGDWYLPSTGEVRHLANNIYQVQKALETDGNPITTPISNGFYWTSNEKDADSAWGCGWIHWDDGTNVTIKSEPLNVRAVRAF